MKVYIYIYVCDMTTDCIWWETSSHVTSQDTICNILYVTAFTRANQWCCSEPNAEVKNFQLYLHFPESSYGIVLNSVLGHLYSWCMFLFYIIAYMHIRLTQFI